MGVCGRLDRAACVKFEEDQPAPLDASPVPIPDFAPESQVPAPTPGRSSTVASTLDANMWGQLSDSEAEPDVAKSDPSLAFSPRMKVSFRWPMGPSRCLRAKVRRNTNPAHDVCTS